MISLECEAIAHLTGSYCCRNDLCLTLESDAAELTGLFGYSAEEIRSIYHNSLLELAEVDARKKLMQRLAEQLSVNDDVELAFPVCHKSGRVIWVLNRGHRVIGEDGKEYLSGVLVDVTKSKNQYDEEKKTLDQYQIILSQTENIIFEWDCITDTIFFSNTWEKIFGYTPKTENISQVLISGERFYPEDGRRLFSHFCAMREGDGYQISEVRIRREDGQYLWCRIRATGSFDKEGKLCRIVGIIINIDAEKKAASALQEQAERDSLTKIYNAHTSRKLAEEYLADVEEDIISALLVIDLDDFKHVNDRYGHMFGDEVLVQAAQTIKKLFRSRDIVGRIGGEEFIVLMKDVPDQRIVNKRCSQLNAAFHDIFKEQLAENELSCSIGVAVSPIHGNSYYDLFRLADRAMYRAKDLGKDRYVIYDPESMEAQKVYSER